MTKNFDVVCIGGVVRDITFYTDKGKIIRTPENLTAQRMIGFEYGAKINIFNTHYTLGGGASNAAHVFSKLGVNASIIARLGSDHEGDEVVKRISEDRIDTGYIQRDQDALTGFSLILCSSKKEHDHVVFSYRGANENLDVNEKVLKNVNPKWFYISSMSGPGWMKTMKNIVSF